MSSSYASRIRPSVQAEMAASFAAEARGNFHTAFQHLERAHVLGQRSTALHVGVHWRMFRFAVRNRQPGAAFGQVWRMAAAAVFTAAGLVPEGNTGGTDVSGLRRLPVPADLKRLMAVALAVSVAACSTPPDLDLSLDKKSAAGVYRVGLVPPAQPPAINQMHSWKVKLATAEGTPVSGAKFAVDGGMPQHGHGLPTQPRVTRELEDGTYQLDGMKFSMTGWWELKLAIEGPQGPDKVTFNTMVNRP
jgi:hypothetical protein